VCERLGDAQSPVQEVCLPPAWHRRPADPVPQPLGAEQGPSPRCPGRGWLSAPEGWGAEPGPGGERAGNGPAVSRARSAPGCCSGVPALRRPGTGCSRARRGCGHRGLQPPTTTLARSRPSRWERQSCAPRPNPSKPRGRGTGRSPGPGCPGRLWSLLLWRYSSPPGRGAVQLLWVTLLGQGVALGDPRGPCQPPTLCDSV